MNCRVSVLFSLLWITVYSKTCNVLDYGGVADNATDISPAITSTFQSCVSTESGSTLLIPAGLYLMNSSLYFRDTHNWTFRLDGTITLAFNTQLGGNMFYWFSCSYVTFTGSGSILGQGNLWRPNNNLAIYPSRPRFLRFERCSYCKISGVTLINAPMFHVVVIGDNNEVFNIEVNADVIGETDAFDISGNNNYVHDVKVRNGDECVTVKSPTNNFLAENIFCNVTAGCNIGSFGNGAGNATVSNVYYRNVTMVGSEAGAQIKTYPNNLGYVMNVTYDTFILSSVAYPMEINVYWCGGSSASCPSDVNGTLRISNVHFKNFSGTEATVKRPAAYLNCLGPALSDYGCFNITFENINVTALDGTTHDSFNQACGFGRPNLPTCNITTPASSSSTSASGQASTSSSASNAHSSATTTTSVPSTATYSSTLSSSSTSSTQQVGSSGTPSLGTSSTTLLPSSGSSVLLVSVPLLATSVCMLI